MQAESGFTYLPDNPSSPKPALGGKAQRLEVTLNAPGLYRVIRRNSELTGFDQTKISIAISKAFLAVEGSGLAASRNFEETIASLTHSVMTKLIRHKPEGGSFHIEEIQDQVELCLVRAGHYQVARAYMLYREARAWERAAGQAAEQHHDSYSSSPGSMVKQAGNSEPTRRIQCLKRVIAAACADLDQLEPEEQPRKTAEVY